MNREIKFRAWNKRTKQYNQYLEIYCYLDGSMGCSAGTSNNNPIGNTEDFILEQWTGLKDKNGKDIYEGDVVQKIYPNSSAIKERLRGYKGVVEFGEFEITTDSWGVVHKCSGWHLEFEDKSGKTSIDSEMEILGNIHENPELTQKH